MASARKKAAAARKKTTAAKDAATEEPYRIPEGAPEREGATGTAADFLPKGRARTSLASLARAAAGCRGCHLYRLGTRTVFGEGPRGARVLIVGEQPGDREDREGHPFVGPSGKLLDDALEEAGIARDDVYVTNAVKHFKWERGEKSERRIHRKPNDRELKACFPWLLQEIATLQPEIVVCLGATAAQSLLGRTFRVTQQRGKALKAPFARVVYATVHPSSVLRAPRELRREAEAEFRRDIAAVGRAVAKLGRGT
jgi:uracil-DNA glycosylase